MLLQLHNNKKELNVGHRPATSKQQRIYQELQRPTAATTCQEHCRAGGKCLILISLMKTESISVTGT
jgi:hypothetical protein